MASRGDRSFISLIGAASAAALLFSPLGAEAAECFDRNIPDPKAGAATAVTGPEVGVQAASAENFARPDAGQDVFTGDRVRTGSQSHLQLKLCDWSTYTFSPNSESEISEFYSADGARRRRVVNFFRGGFRLASGRNTQPGDTEVQIQDSGVTMGVRGTSVLLVELDGVVYALLEGPVLDNTALVPRGQVEFWSGENRDAIIANLRRPGWVVTIGPDGVSEPFRADADLLRRIYEAFVPVIPDEDGDARDYEFAGDPEDDSGQGAQQGNDGSQYADNDSKRESEDTTIQPEPTCGEGIPLEDCFDQAIEVGEILPLEELDRFAAEQLMPDGHVLALAQAQLFVDSGTGPMLADEGVAIIQIRVDWASRTIAPEALASFVKFDFSIGDPSDLTADNATRFNLPPDVKAALEQAVFSSIGISFDSGIDGVAVFQAPLFNFTIRQGPDDTVTADVEVDFSTDDAQNNTFNFLASAFDLTILPGDGELVFFSTPLVDVLTAADFDATPFNDVQFVGGLGFNVASTLGGATPLDGVSYAELAVDFGNRTIGGNGSFLVITAAADPAIGGVKQTRLVSLDQPVSFDDGLFNVLFFPLSSLSSDAAVQQGQAVFSGFGVEYFADIAAILETDNGSHLYTELQAGGGLTPNPVSTVSDMEALTGVLGTGTFHFNGETAGNGFSQITTAGGINSFGQATAAVDINFANRTVGGGNSFAAVNINDSVQGVFVNFVENINALSFDDAASGLGVFGFDSGDFVSGGNSNIESLLLLIRDDATGAAASSADMVFEFNDGAGGSGKAQVTDMPREVGAFTP